MTGGTTYSVVLKEGCGVLNPRIALKWDGTTSPAMLNACFIPAWERYYWVDNWTYEDRQWIASCSVDVLATYKLTIGAASKYILRAADVTNQYVIDNKYPPMMRATGSFTALSGLTYADSFSGGAFIVSVVGKGNTFNAGGANYYAIYGNQLQTLIDNIFTGVENEWNITSLGSNIGEALAVYGDKFVKSIQNPSQFINSVHWVPFSPASVSGVEYIRLGQYTSGVQGAKLTAPVETLSFTCDLNFSGSVADWKRLSPYAKYTLMIPPFGVFELDSVRIVSASGKILGYVYVDLTNGQSTLEVYADTSPADLPLVRASAVLGCDISLAGANINYAGATQSAIGAAGGLIGNIMSGNIAGAITGAASGIIGTAQAAAPTAVNGGYYGGLSSLKGAKGVYMSLLPPVGEDKPDHGEPLCTIDFIQSHSGYILCADGEVAIDGTPAEAAEIAGYLTGGFFYE